MILDILLAFGVFWLWLKGYTLLAILVAVFFSGKLINAMLHYFLWGGKDNDGK